MGAIVYCKLMAYQQIYTCNLITEITEDNKHDNNFVSQKEWCMYDIMQTSYYIQKLLHDVFDVICRMLGFPNHTQQPLFSYVHTTTR